MVVVRKKGYALLLMLTVVLTAFGVVAVLMPEPMPTHAGAVSHRLVIALTLFVTAGANCVLRKRFFTEEH